MACYLFLTLLCSAIIRRSNCAFFSNVVNSVENGYDSVTNSVESLFGRGAPAPAGSFLASAQSPVPMYALSPGQAGSQYAELKALLANSSGPVVYKAAQAMAFLQPEAQTDSSLADRAQLVQLTNNTGTLLVAYANSTLILAFNSTNEIYADLLTASNTSSQELSFLTPFLSGSRGMSRILQSIEDLVNGNQTQSFDSLIANVSNGANPARILTTGFGAGGGLAQLAAVWAAVTWTDTLIRSVSFGAPPVMNNKAGFAFQQFVDLPYVFAYNGSSLINIVLRTIDNNTDPTVNGRYTLADYTAAVINAGAYAQSNGARVANPGIGYEPANSNAAIPSAEGLFGAVPGTFKEVSGTAAAPTPVSEFANQSLIQSLVAAPSPKGSASCPLILCKVRAAAEAACGNYEVFPPGAASFVPILRALPPAQQVVTQPYDTHVVVDWDGSTRKAVLSWRGSITEQDWLQDAKLKQTDGSFLLSSQVKAIFPGLQVHYGFSEQFREVTDKAANSSVNIGAILASKTNGVSPEIVVCDGHSLGASLASLCAVWATGQFPSADILSVTMGQPYTGNQVYVDAFRLLVGREYRIVHQYDIVPSIPPLDEYRHVGLGIWEYNGQVLLADRPPLTLDDLNWQDHSCYNYSITLQQAVNVTILPNATAEVALPSSRRGG